MRRYFALIALVGGLAAPARADEPGAVLRYLPKQADVAVVVDQPGKLADVATHFEPLRQLMTFDVVREQFESTNFKKFHNLVAYYEKTLGKPWPELLDVLAGGGACFGVRFQGEESAAMLVVKSSDEAMMQKAFSLFIDVAKQEAERADAAIKVKAVDYRGITGYQLAKDSFAAAAGPVMFISNKAEAVKAGIDLFKDGPKESMTETSLPAKAHALLPPHPLVWIVGNTARLHDMPAAKEAYKYPRGDVAQLLTSQGVTDVLGKSAFVAAGTYATKDGFRTCVRMPAGRDATPAGFALHLPAAGQPGTLPLLEPKNVLLSWSFYLDAGKLWTGREKLLTEKTRKDIEAAEQKAGRFLGGRKLDEILTSLGNHHRFVAVHQANPGYQRKPNQIQPAFAFVSDLKGPGYAEAMNAILRTAALTVGSVAKLKYKEEKIGDVKLVTYRFPEDGQLANDEAGLRFSFSPCFAKVGNYFLVSSTVELGRELVGILQQPAGPPSDATTQLRFYADGGATLLSAFQDQLLTQTILDRAVPVDQAKREAQKFVDWVRGLGRLDVDVHYGANDFRLDFLLKR